MVNEGRILTPVIEDRDGIKIFSGIMEDDDATDISDPVIEAAVSITTRESDEMVDIGVATAVRDDSRMDGGEEYCKESEVFNANSGKAYLVDPFGPNLNNPSIIQQPGCEGSGVSSNGPEPSTIGGL